MIGTWAYILDHCHLTPHWAPIGCCPFHGETHPGVKVKHYAPHSGHPELKLCGALVGPCGTVWTVLNRITKQDKCPMFPMLGILNFQAFVGEYIPNIGWCSIRTFTNPCQRCGLIPSSLLFRGNRNPPMESMCRLLSGNPSGPRVRELADSWDDHFQIISYTWPLNT